MSCKAWHALQSSGTQLQLQAYTRKIQLKTRINLYKHCLPLRHSMKGRMSRGIDV